MELRNSLEVPAPPERAWDFLLDVERIAPCVPGGELTEIVDESTTKGKVSVKLGPVSLAFSGTVVILERDEATRRVVLKAEGRETRGKGTASAMVTSHLEPGDGAGTRVVIKTDLQISGALSQFGRGMIADVSRRLTDQFAECVRARLTAEEGAPPPVAGPVSGIRLALWALARAIGRFLGRLGRVLRGSRAERR